MQIRDSVVPWCGQERLLTRGDMRAESSKKTRLPALAVGVQGKGVLGRGPCQEKTSQGEPRSSPRGCSRVEGEGASRRG